MTVDEGWIPQGLMRGKSIMVDDGVDGQWTDEG